jgi:hypothetical protein
VPVAERDWAEVPACLQELPLSAPAVGFHELAVRPGLPEVLHSCAPAAGSRALEAH